jgi:hypothetical protein
VKHLRNVAILALIALAIVAVPAAGLAAGLLDAVLWLAMAALLAYFAGRLYRNRRIDIYGLGDRYRAILYLAIAGIVVAFAGSQEFATTAGSLVEFAVLAVCVVALIRVYEVWRNY